MPLLPKSKKARSILSYSDVLAFKKEVKQRDRRKIASGSLSRAVAQRRNSAFSGLRVISIQ